MFDAAAAVMSAGSKKGDLPGWLGQMFQTWRGLATTRQRSLSWVSLRMTGGRRLTADETIGVQQLLGDARELCLGAELTQTATRVRADANLSAVQGNSARSC